MGLATATSVENRGLPRGESVPYGLSRFTACEASVRAVFHRRSQVFRGEIRILAQFPSHGFVVRNARLVFRMLRVFYLKSCR